MAKVEEAASVPRGLKQCATCDKPTWWVQVGASKPGEDASYKCETCGRIDVVPYIDPMWSPTKDECARIARIRTKVGKFDPAAACPICGCLPSAPGGCTC